MSQKSVGTTTAPYPPIIEDKQDIQSTMTVIYKLKKVHRQCAQGSMFF